MPTSAINGVMLRWDQSAAEGVPLVLVHGSLADMDDWLALVPRLSDAFRVVRYDRRGQTGSEAPEGPGSGRDDAAGLAALIEALGAAPAHVIGNSLGGLVALRLACERPELILTLQVHEPPALSLLDPGTPGLEEVGALVSEVGDLLAAGQAEAGARRCVEAMALGPGGWAAAPEEMRQRVVANAPTFLDELRDPEALHVDRDALAQVGLPVFITGGDDSHRAFRAIVDGLAGIMPTAGGTVMPGAGHVPHITHPDAYAALVRKCAGA